MILLNLFLAFLKVGLFAIGGAYSFLPLIEREVVTKYHWLTKDEFLDVLGMVKIFPGAISIKYATYTGYKIGGAPGVIAANIGNLLGPVILIIFASTLYKRFNSLPGAKGALNFVHFALFAMIVAMAFETVNVVQLLQLKILLIVIACFILFLYARIHPALIIVGAGALGFFIRF